MVPPPDPTPPARPGPGGSSARPPELAATILGSGTGVPWRGRSAPGLVVQAAQGVERWTALVDPSAGASHRMAAAGYPLECLTHVLVTHFHPDHTGDLVPLLFALKSPRFETVGAGEPLRLIGPTGWRDLLGKLVEVWGRWIDLGDRVSIQELAVGSGPSRSFFSLGPLEVSWRRVEHTDNSVAYRFECRRTGRALVYSGDTDVCDGIVEIARGADALILDCAFPEGEKRAGHLVPSEAGKIATAAGVSRLILTHFYPECRGRDLIAECRKTWSGAVELAEDGLTVNL